MTRMLWLMLALLCLPGCCVTVSCFVDKDMSPYSGANDHARIGLEATHDFSKG